MSIDVVNTTWRSGGKDLTDLPEPVWVPPLPLEFGAAPLSAGGVSLGSTNQKGLFQRNFILLNGL